MKKLIALTLAAILCVAFGVSASADYSIAENGEAIFETAAGYTFTINDINGKIEGEDATILTSASGLNNCSPWVVWFVAEKRSDNVYEAVTNGTWMEGTKPKVTLNNDQIIVVIHSASSNPDTAEYNPNWEDRAVALAIKAGDWLKLESIDIASETCDNGKMTVITKEEADELITGDGIDSWVWIVIGVAIAAIAIVVFVVIKGKKKQTAE
ncbi:MAG: hypothetical protein IJB49_09025 [Clostridia bacterium]|nr:hypothetical protein [Clostridia bacterium]